MSRHRAPRTRRVPRSVRWITLLSLLLSALLIGTAAPSYAGDDPRDRHGRHHDGQEEQERAGNQPDRNADQQDRDRGDRQRGEKRERPQERQDAPAPPVENNCSLRVPEAPQTAAGLATPYVLIGCDEANPDQGAFVEATIVNPDGTLAVYRPLVINHGTDPAATPTAPALRAGAVVGVWFGFQGDNLKLTGSGARQCVNGLRDSLFGQFAYCNAPAFFKAVAAAGVQAPPLQTAADGNPCPTVRDFLVVDQDQSDNVTTEYLILPDGTTAQNTAQNRALLPQSTVLVNASDNGLLNRKINPALGCANFTAPDLTDPQGPAVPSLALNELQAMAQPSPIALIPVNNPMTLVDDEFSVQKTILYRLGVGQPVTGDLFHPRQNARAYCTNMINVGLPRLQQNAPRFAAVASPDPAFPDLDAFLLDRFTASLQELKCNVG